MAVGFALVHTSGIAVNRAGQGFSGKQHKSDPRDARTIAKLIRTSDLRPILADDDTRVTFRLKVRRRSDLMQDQVRRIASIRGLLSGIHPSLEQVFDTCSKGLLALLSRYVTPRDIRRAGKARTIANLKKTLHPQGCEALEARQKIVGIERDLEHILSTHPEYALIRSLPGMGVILTAEFLAAMGNIERLTSANALAAVRLETVRRQSGKKMGWRRAYCWDNALKRVFSQSAFYAVTKQDPLSKALYDRKRKEGYNHTHALIALARRRVNVLWTMLQRREAFDPNRKAA